MIERVHPTAARGFDVAADAYERARPGYPAEAVEALGQRLDLRRGRTVLDLAAGTGKLTRALVPTGSRVIAVEPVPGMRARLRTTAPGAEVLDGTAESIPLPAGSVDAVVVAQAFHWFNAIRALSEIHRVLRPGGHLALLWNRRDEAVPWVRALSDLMRPLEAGEPGTRSTAWRDALARCGLFEPFESALFRHAQALTTEGVVDRVASVSYVAAADPVRRAAVLDGVRELLRSDPATSGRDEVELPYETELMWAARLGPTPGREGLVASVNTNDGGVPKLPVDRARIERLGLDGDRHRSPVHGGENGAVCLYAQEAVERVRADGHQAFPGAFGENLTLLGIDWPALEPGDRLAIGADDDGPLLELTQDATPCQTQAHWFLEGRIVQISHKVHPEDARWYARVLREGAVRPWMPVRVIPART